MRDFEPELSSSPQTNAEELCEIKPLTVTDVSVERRSGCKDAHIRVNLLLGDKSLASHSVQMQHPTPHTSLGPPFPEAYSTLTVALHPLPFLGHIPFK